MALNIVQTIDDRVRIRTVLISVSDKTGLDLLVTGLASTSPGLRILSTGGTYDTIQKILGPSAAAALEQVSRYTGQPEMQGGLVKTLDFKIYLGLLSETYNPAHHADLERAGAVPIDMVVVNLYPFGETVARSETTPETARANIDVGGPCMTRAAAKNFHRVAVLTDPRDYGVVVNELAAAGGSLSLATRWRLARTAFRLTAAYDAAVSEYLDGLDFPQVSAVYDVKKGN
ncbi:MAG TPA: hypothetical protein VMV03_06265 [Spirochaetia bacterium]|nr:hypothetical protein [Spirochaetia bacterium]